MLNEQSDHFSGDTLLSRQEELKNINTLVGRGREGGGRRIGRGGGL